MIFDVVMFDPSGVESVPPKSTETAAKSRLGRSDPLFGVHFA
jgi:hypothetical protein